MSEVTPAPVPAAAPAPMPVARAAWASLPPIQRSATAPAGVADRGFGGRLPTWQNPSFARTSPLGVLDPAPERLLPPTEAATGSPVTGLERTASALPRPAAAAASGPAVQRAPAVPLRAVPATDSAASHPAAQVTPGTLSSPAGGRAPQGRRRAGTDAGGRGPAVQRAAVPSVTPSPAPPPAPAPEPPRGVRVTPAPPAAPPRTLLKAPATAPAVQRRSLPSARRETAPSGGAPATPSGPAGGASGRSESSGSSGSSGSS
ncbi:hypothetical protein NGM37_53370, partial [Streptomyces sp. TRM76130]|nr:hypothetical protein [Streptomyces sp. TRM76130]